MRACLVAWAARGEYHRLGLKQQVTFLQFCRLGILCQGGRVLGFLKALYGLQTTAFSLCVLTAGGGGVEGE